MNEEGKYKRVAIGILVVVSLVSTFFGYQAYHNFGTDYDFEKFFPKNDAETDFFLAYRDKFETDNDFLLLAVCNETGIFDETFLKKISILTDSLQQLPYITNVESPTNLEEIIFNPLGLITERPYLRYDQPQHYKKDSIRIFQSPELVNSFFSEDGKAISILARHEQYLSKLKCDQLSQELNELLTHFKFDELHIAGRAVGQNYFVKRIEMELAIFVSASIVLITLFLILAFRSSWGVWVPLFVVLLSIIWLIGIMVVVFDKQFDILLTIIPTILFVVGMSDVVHIITKYFDELRTGIEKLPALKTAFKEIGIATFLTSLTTAIGFLTLLTSSIVPTQEFGLIAAIGVFVAYILAYSLLPAVLLLSPTPKIVEKNPTKVFWNHRLSNFLLFIIRNRKAVFLGIFVVLGICIWGISRVEVNNFLLEDLRDNDPMKQDFMFFEEKFAGVRPFEMQVTVVDPGKNIFDRDVQSEIEKIEKYLQTDYGIGFVVSPTTIIKTLHRASHGAKPDYYRLPENQIEFDKYAKQVKRISKSAQLRAIVTKDLKEGRIFGKMGDWGNKEIQKMDRALEEFMIHNVRSDLIETRQTGTARLIDLNNNYLSATMIQGLLIAFLAIAFIVGIMFRSMRMVIISLIPNILPLLLVAAFMGFFGIDLKVSTAIVFTIAFGIAVDDTIHFVARLRLELNKGKSIHYAIKRTFIGTGKAIIVTSLILCAGFLTLLMSSFMGTFYTGLLISLTLLFAVLSDLMILPVLLWFFYKRSK